MRILIIDDDQELTAYLKLALEDFHHQIDVAHDGIIGEQMALENDYDIILLDVMLPGANGFLICKTLRHNGVKIPILMLTSLETSQEEVTGYIAGATDYLIKPIDFDLLYKKIIAYTLDSKLTT